MSYKSSSLILLFVLVLTRLSICQNQANNWFLNNWDGAGVSFNTGAAIAITNNAIKSFGNGGTASISDTNGNVLFYSDGLTIFNKNDEVMANGSGLDGDYGGSQPVAICEMPGYSNLFYVFTIGSENVSSGLKYSIVDLLGDNGKGVVISKNITLNTAIWARDKIAIAKHSNNRDYWIVTRIINSDYYASFLLTPNGISDSPILSKARFMEITGLWRGPLKFSPDFKKLISAHRHLGQIVNGSFEVSNFNNSTGEIDFQFSIKEFTGSVNDFPVLGIEISPDSKLLYVSFLRTDNIANPDHYTWIYQYDLTQSDSLSFLNSHIPITTTASVAGLQLAPDGKIYGIKFSFQPGSDTLFSYLDRIENVWERGPFCNFVENAVSLLGRKSYDNLPNFPQDLLYRFIWQGGPCAKTPYTFTHRFIPEPQSINWDFGDGQTSQELNPVHIFQQGGTYEVHAYVVYPDGRIEETSREVEVLPAPEPDLGPDQLMCSAQPITLDAGSDFDRYNWNGAFTPGQRTYVVSDTGTYWVRAMNSFGCFASDTVHVGLYPSPSPDTTNLILSPTTCGGSTGAIRGLTVSGTEPIALEWKNNAGTVLSNEEDIYNLPVGNYYLWATDGNGCTNLVSQYTIGDAGDVLIASVSHSDSYCGQNNGSITITAVSGLSDMLEYSIDNGITWHSNEGLFEGLNPVLDYDVRVRVPDGSGCEAVYAFNPVMIDDFSGPQVIASSEPSTGSNANGSITLTATGFGNLSYTLNGGTPQSSGEFTGLIAGTYTWRVEDENGCFTEGSIEVGQEAGFIISAIAGNSAVCLGNAPIAPLLIENFTGVQAFTATLEYDATLVNCKGFRPGSVHPQLAANLIAEVFPASQRIVVTWSGSVPLTLTGTVTVLDLVFSATQAGNSFLTWDQAPAATWFTGEYGSIEPEFQIGQIQVNHPPVLAQQIPVNVCEGELAWLSATATGNEPLNYQWTLPDGSIVNDPFLIFLNASSTHAGQYRVKVSDALGCSDSTLLTLQVTPNPRDWFLHDTILFENQYLLAGPAGYASYLWSTGDTMPEITVNTEGLYTLQLTTHNLCAGADSTYLKMLEAESPFLVPNAFTPNGDGLNDTFRPVVDYERVRMFSMVIYNRWGQLFFETTNPAEGWDGKDAPAGVYSWVISYSDIKEKVYQTKGIVTLIK